jgi:hypothetical protein
LIPPRKKLEPTSKILFKAGLLLLIVVGVTVAGILYWHYVYIPSEVWTALRTSTAPPASAPWAEIPPFIEENFSKALPHLLEALYGEEEEEAAIAFAALKSTSQGVHAVKEKGIRLEDEGGGTFRALLLIQSVEGVHGIDSLGLPEAFLSRYFRWVGGTQSGLFRAPNRLRETACKTLYRMEKNRSLAFFYTLLKDFRTPTTLKIFLSGLVGRVEGDAKVLEDVYTFLTSRGLPPGEFLFHLAQREPALSMAVMKKAFRGKDLTQTSVAMAFFLRHLSPEVAAFLMPELVSKGANPGDRERIAHALQRVEEPWAAEVLARAIAQWTEKEALPLLDFGPIKRPPCGSTYLRLLWLAGKDRRICIREAAMNGRVRWEHLSGMSAFAPYGTPVPGAPERALPALDVPPGVFDDPETALSWLRNALRGLRSLETHGRIGPVGQRIAESVRAAAEHLEKVSKDPFGDPVLRRELTWFIGRTLAMHETCLEKEEGLRRILLDRVRAAEEGGDVRFEAAVWLGYSGAREPGIRTALETGMKEASPRLRYACAGALTHMGSPSALSFLRNAWEGDHPVAAYFAIAEVPRLPTRVLEGLVPSLKPLEASLHGDLRKASANALSFIFCTRPKDAFASVASFQGTYRMGELPDFWAYRAQAVADPEGDTGVLDSLAETLGRNDGDAARAAGLLLRHWTGKSLGFDGTLEKPDHAREIAGRWRRWLDRNRIRLAWDPEGGTFRTR